MFVKISLRKNTNTEGLLMFFGRKWTCTRRIQLITYDTEGNFYQAIHQIQKPAT